jgi:drug/metabolite transporter superfamily protein YnfA
MKSTHFDKPWYSEDNIVLTYLLFVVILYRSFLYLFNSTIFFNPLGFIDPYVYIGIGLYYGIPDFLADYYKISRVPWNVLQFVMRQTLLPGSAAFVLQTLTAALTSTSILICFRALIGNPKSFLLASLSIFIPLLQRSGGADYHNSFSGGLFFLTLALTFLAILRASTRISFCAGAALAATIHTNPLFVLLFPMIALQTVVLCFQHHRSASFIVHAAWFALGGIVITTAMLGIVHIMLGRTALFFLPQLKFIFFLAKNNDLWTPISWEWFRTSKENGYLIGVFLFCTMELTIMAAQKTLSQNREAMAAYGGFIITYSIAVVCQLKGQTALQPDYYSYVFICATIIPLAHVINRYVYVAPYSVWIYAGFPLMCVLSLIFNQETQRALHISELAPFTEVVCVTVGLYALMILLKSAHLGISSFLIAAFNGILVNPGSTSYQLDSCHSHRHLTVLMSKISTMGTELVKRPESVFVWFDRNERLAAEPCFKDWRIADLGSSLTSIGHKYLGENYGGTPLTEFTREIFPQTTAIILLVTSREDVQTKFTETAQRVGVDLRLLALYQDRESGIKFMFFAPYL